MSDDDEDDYWCDEDLRSLYAARDAVTEAIRRTHAGAAGRVNLSEVAKAARAPMFKRRDQICRLIHTRRVEGRSWRQRNAG